MFKNIYEKSVLSIFFIFMYAVPMIAQENNPIDDTTESSSKIGTSKSYDECKQEEVDTEKEKLQCLLQKSNLWDRTTHTPNTLSIDAIMHDFLSIDPQKKTAAIEMLVCELVYTKIKQDQIDSFIQKRYSDSYCMRFLPCLVFPALTALYGYHCPFFSPRPYDRVFNVFSGFITASVAFIVSVVLSKGQQDEIENTKNILHTPWQRHIDVLKFRLKPDEFADLNKRADTIFDAYRKEFPRVVRINQELVATFVRTK